MHKSSKRRYSHSPSVESKGSRESRPRRHRSREQFDREGKRTRVEAVSYGQTEGSHPPRSYDRYRSERSREKRAESASSCSSNRSDRNRRHRRYYRSPSPTSPQESPNSKCEKSPSFDSEDEEDMFEAGNILSNRYKVIETLGDGTFSRVVQVYDLELNQVSVIEIMKNLDNCKDPGRLEMNLKRPSNSRNARTRTETPTYSNFPYNNNYNYAHQDGHNLVNNQPYQAQPAAQYNQGFPTSSYSQNIFPLGQNPIRPPIQHSGNYYGNQHWNQGNNPNMMGRMGGHSNLIRPPGNSMHRYNRSEGLANNFQPRIPKSESNIVRSQLLEDFRNNILPDIQIKNLTKHIIEFSQDQHGSRFIQQKLKHSTNEEKDLVFSEIIEHAHNLMLNMFGNYVIQKFFEYGNVKHRMAFAGKMKGQIFQLSFNMYGCRVIQKALETLPPEGQLQIAKEITTVVIDCVKDQNGNHVVQKCIECVEPESIHFLIESFYGKICEIAAHPYGCRVIQKILTHGTPKQIIPVLKEFHDGSEQLMQDQFGNYVVQHVLEKFGEEDRSKVVTMILGNVLDLSQHKFASNVVEKCVSYGTPKERAIMIEEVLVDDSKSSTAVITMIKDQYANYVVQKMLELACEPQKQKLVEIISPEIATLKCFTYGNHFLTKMKEVFDHEE